MGVVRTGPVPAYVEHGPIDIGSDSQFSWQGWPGSGTEADPYVIEGFNITAGSDSCIQIRSTTVYFVIRGCFLSSSSTGIYLFNVQNGRVENNTITGCPWTGMCLSGCSNTIVTNNTIIDAKDYGIRLVFSSDNTLTDNTISDNGIFVEGSTITDWRHTIAPNNTVNGGPVGYFWNMTGGTIDGSQYGQVILANCTGVTVRDGVFHNVTAGVELGFCENSTLTNNTMSENSVHGLELETSYRNMITNSTALDNAVYGMYLHLSQNNTLANNTVSGNTEQGMYIYFSSNNALIDNTITRNGVDGVCLGSVTSNNVLTKNTIGLNNGTGVTNYGQSNLLYLNSFDSNVEGNALDNGFDSQWNTTGVGNYWSDYNGTGTYKIPGTAGSIDYHPMEIPDIDAPLIDHPSDIEYAEGTTGHTLTWSPSDAHPDRYELYRNGTVANSGSWNGEQITVSIDGLSLGVYNYTIVVHDEAQNSISDTVIVTVVDGTAPVVSHPDDVEYVEGSRGHSITWVLSDAHPATYELYRNGTLVGSGTWASGEIMVSVDGLNVGTYNYTLVANDEAGHSTSDTVFVTVTPANTTSSTTTTTTTTGTTTTTSTTTLTTTTTGGTTTGGGIPQDTLIIILLGGAAVVVVVILVIFMVKRR
ncbi:MAG: right-handed parallel beta-helix repeat-containing protein [Candidatus Thorarchaeota archaeon]